MFVQIKKAVPALLLLLLPFNAHAALFTASVTGNWNDGATWGNTSPGVEGTDFPAEDGTDTFAINSGVTVTIPSSYLLAHSSGTFNGNLTIEGTLKLSGTFILGNDTATWAMAGGSVLDVDGNTIDISNFGGTNTSVISLVGTLANPVTIMSSGANGTMVETSGNHTGDTEYTNVNISGISVARITPWIDTQALTITNLKLTGIDTLVMLGTINKVADWSINGLTIVDATATTAPAAVWSLASSTPYGTDTGTRSISNVVLDNARYIRNVALTAAVLPSGIDGFLVDETVWEDNGVLDYNNWLITDRGAGTENVGGSTLSNGYYFSDQVNSHAIDGGGGKTLTGSIIENTNAATDGHDAFIVDSGHTGTSNVLNNIFLFGWESAALNALGSTSAGTINFDHNTIAVLNPSDNSYGSIRNETSGMFGGTVNIRSNLVVYLGAVTSSTRGINIETAGIDQIDNTDFNAWVNVADPYFQVTQTGSTEGDTGFGESDITDDPQFSDSTANGLAAWDASLGGAGTAATAIAELLKINEPTFNSNYTVANAIAYIQAGFTPTNVAYDDTAHDGGDIGAVAYVAPSSSVARQGRMSMESMNDMEM